MMLLRDHPVQLETKKSTSGKKSQRKRRGIYILPNLLTTGALFFGFFAIIQANLNHFEIAAVAILIAAVLDGLDGRVARLTDTASDFGKEYDSLADVISFGLAPVLVVFEWVISDLGKAGWLCAFLYVSATALRLARFNTQSTSPNSNYFQGLPCPMAAVFLVSWMWVIQAVWDGQITYVAEMTTAIVFILAVSMVSSIPYLSFKNFGLRGRVPFVASIAMVLAIVLISFDPPKVLFVLFLVYVLSGPVMWITGKSARKPRVAMARSKSDANKE